MSVNRISQTITNNISNGAARAMLYGVGLKRIDLRKYLVGIGSMQFDINPCNKHLGYLQDLAKKSVNEANMVGLSFNTIGVSDGITNGNSGMRYSLPSRELIADSIETMINAHHYDGAVLIPGCDKNLPATMMAMGRINRPSVLLYGGSMLPGVYKNKPVDIVNAFQSYGQLINNQITIKQREDLLESCCHKNGGSCSGMYTCNTMATIAEVMGLTIPFSSSYPASSSEKRMECSNIGKHIFNLLQNDIKPRDIVTRDSFLNAIKLTTILGGSTNAVIHLLAIAKEFDIQLSLQDFQDISNNTPILGNLKPHGKYTMNDIHYQVNGLPTILKYLIKNNIIDGRTYTITGHTLQDNIDKLNLPDLDFQQKVIFPMHKPFKEDGHIRVMKGNLSPKGAIAKISGNEGEYFHGTAKVYDNEDSMIQDLEDGNIIEGNVVVIRYQGPKGGIGMPEMLKPSSALVGAGLSNKVALITDGRWSGGSSGFLVGHITPEAIEKGPIAIIQDGDQIDIDAKLNTITLLISDEEIQTRMKKITLPINESNMGYLNKYQKLVSDASNGCVTN